MKAESTHGTLILVDGYSLLFRAFFAGQALSTSDNRPTGALFGFANMILSLINNDKPDSIVVCWDAHAPTFRSQEFTDYKAHRPEADPLLKAQIPTAREMVREFGIPAVELAGYEADDLIGTLAARGSEFGYHVIIITGDSDQLQLVTPKVDVQITMRGVSERKSYDAEAVRERYGVSPEQIADFKALTGDVSDNIPGVPGIGEKTAAALLQQFGTVENLLENLDQVKPPRAQKSLMENIQTAKLCKRLATIVCDVPIEFQFQPYSPGPEVWKKAKALFENLEFRTLINRLPKDSSLKMEFNEAESSDASFPVNAKIIQSLAELEEALQEAVNAPVAGLKVHLQGDSLFNTSVLGIAFATDSEHAYYIKVHSTSNGKSSEQNGLFPVELEKEEDYSVPLSRLADLLENPKAFLAGHDVKREFSALRMAGMHPHPFSFDTRIAAYLLDAGRSSYPLHSIAEAYLKRRINLEHTFEEVEGIILEAATICALVAPMRTRLEEADMSHLFANIEMPLIPVLASIEQTGLLVDSDYLKILGSEMGLQIRNLTQDIYSLAGEEFNIGSTKQLQEILFNKMHLPTGKKTKTGYSTGADLLEQLAADHEIARKILDYREVTKLKVTYADALIRLIQPSTHRVHTTLHQTVASTGRLSSSDPNLQNIPVRSEIGRMIRRSFIAPQGRLLLSCDYSQVELRVLAHITGDQTLTCAFLEGEDIHTATAAIVFDAAPEDVTKDQRRQAKTINFAVIYGQSAFTLSATLGVDPGTAKKWIAEYFDRLPGVYKYIEDMKKLAHSQAWVQTLLGRRRYLPDLHSGNFQLRQAAERAAVNMPIQGTAADIMKLAMIRVADMFREKRISGCDMLLQVHDELLFEVEEAFVLEIQPQIVRCMEEAYPMNVPLQVDSRAGKSWADLEPVE